MRYLAYVIGNDPEAILKKNMDHEFEFVVADDIKEVCDKADVLYDPANPWAAVKNLVKKGTKVALIDTDQAAVICPKLWEAGFRHFITMDHNGNIKTIERLRVKEELSELTGLGDDDGFPMDKDPAVIGYNSDFLSIMEREQGSFVRVSSYELGGNWPNVLIPKPGVTPLRPYQMRFGDVDWDAMFDRAKEFVRAECGYDKLKEINDRYSFKNRRQIKIALGIGNKKDTELTAEDYEKLNKLFDAQEGIQKVREAIDRKEIPPVVLWTSWVNDPEDWWEYHAKEYLHPALIITEDDFHCRVNEGFAGVLEEDHTATEWEAIEDRVFDAVDPNTLITIVDVER